MIITITCLYFETVAEGIKPRNTPPKHHTGVHCPPAKTQVNISPAVNHVTCLVSLGIDPHNVSEFVRQWIADLSSVTGRIMTCYPPHKD